MNGSMVSPVFAGRVGELSMLAEAYERARTGRPAVVLIGAAAGGGKTRLVDEFGRGRRSLSGGCVELGSAGLPYAPFTAMLRRLGTEKITTLLPEGTAPELARLLPALGEPPSDPDTGTGRVRLFEHLLALLERFGAEGPFLLVVEDAHWADWSTRDMLSFLARNLHRTPVLLLVTHRSDELHRTHPLRPLLAELSRLEPVTRLELPPLGRAEVAEQLAGILGGTADPALVREVHARSAGNPLFVEAVAGHRGDSVPESLRDLLLAGVRRLPGETQDVLRTAAAGGDSVRHDLLAAVTGMADHDLVAALRPAVDHNVLVTEADGYAFRHALIRAAVHEELLPGERTRLHVRYAEMIEESPRLSDGPAVALAAHRHAAHDDVRALTAAWHAASERAASAAYAEQLRLLERVLELWDRVPDAATLIGRPRIRVLEAAALAASACGEAERGLGHVAAALAAIDRARDPEHAAGLLMLRAGLRGFDGLAGEIEDLREAERVAAEPTSTRAQVLARLSSRLLASGAGEHGAALGAEGLALAGRLGDRATGVDLAITIAAVAARDGEGDLAPLEAARTAAEQGGHAAALLRALTFLSHCYEGAGRSADAVLTAAEGRAVARRIGLASSTGLPCLVNHAESLISLGRWDEAAQVIEQAPEHGEGSAFRTQMLIWRAALAHARGTEPPPDEQVMAVPFETGAPQTTLPLATALIERRLAEGDRLGARAVLRAALADPALTSQPRYTWPFLVAGAQVGGDLLEAVRAVAARTSARGPVSAAHAATVAATGTLDRTAWVAAISAWEALDRPYELAQALVRATPADMAAGDRATAAARLERAAELAARLGAEPLAAEISERYDRLDLGHRLTAREHEVLTLLALGRSNQAIAAELFISAKTASVHVSNILRKLGVASRGEAAAAARDLGL